MTHDWFLIATIVGAAATLIGVPLTAIVFYLKAIREDQRELRASVQSRVSRIETEFERMESAIARVERRYTTRDDWMREAMLARSQLTRLTEMTARLHAEMESSRALATQFVRATHAIIELAERLGQRITSAHSDSV